jgi:hypothetical protein
MAALLMSRCCLSPATDGSKTRSCEDDCPQDVRAVQSHPGDRAERGWPAGSASHRQCPRDSKIVLTIGQSRLLPGDSQ